MQAVDVLRHHGRDLALALELGELDVGLVGLGAQRDHLLAVEVEELLGVALVEAVGEHLLRRIAEVLVVEAIDGAEVGDAARRGDAGAAEEHDVSRLADACLELCCRLAGVCDRCAHDAPLDVRRRERRAGRPTPTDTL